MTKCISILFFLIIALSGCAGEMEVDRISFPVAMGIDYDEEKSEIKVYTQISTTSSSQGNQPQQTEKSFKVLDGHGNTLLDAMADVTSKGSQNILWKHINVIIFTDEMVKHGISDELDLLCRFQQIHLNSYLIVTKDDLNELLGSKPKIKTSLPSPLAGIRLVSEQSSHTKPITIREFVMAYLSNGMDPIMPEVSILKDDEKEAGNEMEIGLDYPNLGIFREDKLVGYLDSDETKGAILVYGKENISRILIPKPKDDTKIEFTIHSITSKPEIVPEINNNKPRININLAIEYTIAQINTSAKIDTKKADDINKQVEAYVKKSVQKTLNKVQKEYLSDIFGFGEKIYRKYPAYWLKNKGKWDKIYPTIDISVQVTADFRNTGQILNSLKHTKKAED